MSLPFTPCEPGVHHLQAPVNGQVVLFLAVPSDNEFGVEIAEWTTCPPGRYYEEADRLERRFSEHASAA